jgi:hypothetical protein
MTAAVSSKTTAVAVHQILPRQQSAKEIHPVYSRYLDSLRRSALPCAGTGCRTCAKLAISIGRRLGEPTVLIKRSALLEFRLRQLQSEPNAREWGGLCRQTATDVDRYLGAR